MDTTWVLLTTESATKYQEITAHTESCENLSTGVSHSDTPEWWIERNVRMDDSIPNKKPWEYHRSSLFSILPMISCRATSRDRVGAHPSIITTKCSHLSWGSEGRETKMWSEPDVTSGRRNETKGVIHNVRDKKFLPYPQHLQPKVHQQRTQPIK
jgi:hypothetical protein